MHGSSTVTRPALRPVLAPNPSQFPPNYGVLGTATSQIPERQPVVRSRANITTACLACKRRKRKCSGGHPCPACATTGLECVYDVHMDKRRKSYSRVAKAEMQFHGRLLSALLAAIRSDKSAEVTKFVKGNPTMDELAKVLGIDMFDAEQSPVDIDYAEIDTLPILSGIDHADANATTTAANQRNSVQRGISSDHQTGFLSSNLPLPQLRKRDLPPQQLYSGEVVSAGPDSALQPMSSLSYSASSRVLEIDQLVSQQ